MNDKMVLGQYYNTDSFIHRLDPRIKMFGIIILMIVTFLIPFGNFTLLGSLYIFILLIIILSNVPIMKYFKSLKQIAFLLLFSVAFQLFARKNGNVLVTLNLSFSIINILVVSLILVLFVIFRKHIPYKFFIFLGLIVLGFYLFTLPMGVRPFAKVSLSIYDDGVKSASFIVLRVLALIIFATTLTLTTKPMDLASGIEWYLKPLELIKLKPSILAMMISIALRFIPTLFNETTKILKAQASRGVDFKEGKLHEQIKQIISLLVPMFIISFKRAIDLANAMEARGYIPGEKRTKLLKLSFKIKDLIAFLVLVAILVFMIIWRTI